MSTENHLLTADEIEGLLSRMTTARTDSQECVISREELNDLFASTHASRWRESVVLSQEALNNMLLNNMFASTCNPQEKTTTFSESESATQPKSDTTESSEQPLKSQLKMWQCIHEKFATAFASKLEDKLRTPAHVEVLSVENLTYAEFRFGCENPTYYNVVHVEPFGENIIVNVSLQTIYELIARMLGSWHEPSASRRYPLTKIESCLAGEIMNVLFDSLKEAWGITELEFSVVQTAGNPLTVEFVPDNEPVFSASLNVAFDSSGVIDFCVPQKLASKIKYR